MKQRLLMLILITLMGGMMGCHNSLTTPTTQSVPTIDVSDLIDDYDTYDDVIEATTYGWASSHQLVTVEASHLVITTPGTYYLYGEIKNGQIKIDVGDDDDVILVFAGLSMTNSTQTAIVIDNAHEVILNLKKDQLNALSITQSSTEVTSVIESADDLTITGEGTLAIINSAGDGINAHDDFVLGNGLLTIKASHHGIEVNNQLTVVAAELSVEAEFDGIHCENTDALLDSSVTMMGGSGSLQGNGNGLYCSGSIYIVDGNYVIVGGKNGVYTANNSQVAIKAGALIQMDGGSLIVQSLADGLQSDASIHITGGTLTVESGDDGLHTIENLIISGGTIEITADEDGFQSDSSCYITGGVSYLTVKKDGINALNTVQIQSGLVEINASDDGIHADTSIKILGGDVTVTKSYEGFESLNIEISGGTLDINASDDGINAVDETASSTPFPGGMDGGGSATLTVSGGTTYVNASGDGIDINGSIKMTNGILIICGPTNSGNGALDYDSTFVISGGYLVAAGSSGMAQNISSSSSQCGVLITLSSTSTLLFSLLDEDGNVLIAFDPIKTYQSIVISTPDMKKNSSYQLYLSGTVSDYESLQSDCYIGGKLENGTLKQSFTLTSVATTIGSSMGGRR